MKFVYPSQMLDYKVCPKVQPLAELELHSIQICTYRRTDLEDDLREGGGSAMVQN